MWDFISRSYIAFSITPLRYFEDRSVTVTTVIIIFWSKKFLIRLLTVIESSLKEAKKQVKYGELKSLLFKVQSWIQWLTQFGSQLDKSKVN